MGYLGMGLAGYMDCSIMKSLSVWTWTAGAFDGCLISSPLPHSPMIRVENFVLEIEDAILDDVVDTLCAIILIKTGSAILYSTAVDAKLSTILSQIFRALGSS